MLFLLVDSLGASIKAKDKATVAVQMGWKARSVLDLDAAVPGQSGMPQCRHRQATP
jgi:hypothetical protein